MLELVLCLAFAFSMGLLLLTRALLAGNRTCSGDTFFHLLISKSIRESHGRFPSAFKNVTFDEGEKKYHYLSYPPLFHYLTALFPARAYLKVSRFLNIVILAGVSTIAALCVYNLTFNGYLAVLAAFVAIFNMAVFELEVMFTPRPLGLLLYSILFYLVVFSPQSALFTGVIALTISLIILTHKFATQAILFVLVSYAVVFGNVSLIVALGFGFLLAILLSRGSYLGILKEHASWLYFYAHHPNKASYVYKLRRVIIRNLWYLPLLFASAVLFAQRGPGMFGIFNVRVLFWAFVPLIVAVLVALPKLSFLGEDYRYIEYSVVPVSITLMLLLATLNIYAILATVACFGAYSVLIQKYKRHLNQAKELVDSDDIKAYHSLTEYNPCQLLVFPSTRTLEVHYFTELNVIHPVRTKTTVTEKEYLEHLMRDYKVQYILRFKDVDPSQRFAILSEMVKMKKVRFFKNIELFEISA